MLRKTKLIYIMGSAVIGVLTVLTVLLAMISTGVIDGRQKKVVFASASAVFTYDGQEHTETQWEIKDGELKSGHTAKVVVSGTQTEAPTLLPTTLSSTLPARSPCRSAR